MSIQSAVNLLHSGFRRFLFVSDFNRLDRQGYSHFISKDLAVNTVSAHYPFVELYNEKVRTDNMGSAMRVTASSSREALGQTLQKHPIVVPSSTISSLKEHLSI